MAQSSPHPQPHSQTVRLFFGLTIGLGAGLLFWQQLMLGRAMLPKFGGVPAVWLVSLAVFQTILLLGYALAHSVRRWGSGSILFLLLAFAASAAFQQLYAPILQAPELVTPGTVIAALLGLAAFSLLLLSMISPIMQGLYARLPQRDAEDPYFFYSASNFGSFAGLLLFPLLLEPFFGLAFSQKIWLAAAAIFLAMLLASLAFMMRAKETHRAVPRPTEARKRWLLWLGLAFLPSALSFSATSHLINDIAPVPLLSMVPLALYLLTFVLAFGKPARWQETLLSIQPFLVAFYIFRLVASHLRPAQFYDLLLVLAVFFVTAFKCHRTLAQSRPPAGDLTFYYLIVALGGALGAIVNLTIIPFILPLPLEFSLFLLAALLPGFSQDTKKLRQTNLMKIHIILGLLLLLTLAAYISQPLDDRLRYVALPLLIITLVALIVRPAFLAVISLLLIGLAVIQLPDTVAIQRDFFGVKRITQGVYPDGNTYRVLFHGTTLHGGQKVLPQASSQPLFYYGPGSGIDDVMQLVVPTHTAIIGMGAGSMACAPGRKGPVRFFEIDPGMVRLAQDDFTFLKDCPHEEIVVGDGRLTLARDKNRYDLIMVDAFSSDSIPVHLLTKEAFESYRDHLAPQGAIILHLSNRYLDLLPVTEGAAKAEGWKAATHFAMPQPDQYTMVPNQYAVLSANDGLIQRLIHEKKWRSLENVEPVLWTDDKLSLIPLFKVLRKNHAQKNGS